MKKQKTITIKFADWKRMVRLRLRCIAQDQLCACGNYFTSPRYIGNIRCDLGHKK